jgi:hypothetical protein
MKLKKGQRVKLLPYTEDYDDEGPGVNEKMQKLFGGHVTIYRVNNDYYDDGEQTFEIEEDHHRWTWVSTWIDQRAAIHLPEDLFKI